MRYYCHVRICYKTISFQRYLQAEMTETFTRTISTQTKYLLPVEATLEQGTFQP